MVDLNILRVDLDLKTKKECMNHLKERLSYFQDLNFLNFRRIKKIVLIKKKTYSVKITLDIKLKRYHSIILLESLLGSDYRKQVNCLINYNILGMKHYPDRLFTIKRYKGEGFIVAKTEDITLEIMDYIYLDREKWKN